MIYRIFIEPFKSESPSSKYSQDHETEHRSVFPISVKAPSSSPPTLEWLISCPRLPLGNLGRYRNILSSPLQLISSICFLLFHKRERTPFIPNPIRLLFFSLSFSLFHSCASGALLPLTIISFTRWRYCSFEFENSCEISTTFLFYYPSPYFVLT